MSDETGSVEAGNPEPAAVVAPEAQPAPAAPPATNDFLAGVQDAELRDWASTKGISAPDQALSSYRNLEKLMGADKAGRTVTLLGDEPTAEESSAFYDRLGRPAKADGYTFGAPEGADPAYANAAKAKFHELGITDSQASAIVEWQAEQISAATGGQEVDYTASVDADKATLRTEWGAAHDAKLSQAKKAAVDFGLDGEMVEGLEKTMGYAPLMRFMSNIGSKLGEDTLIGTDTNTGSEVMTPAQAKIKMSELTGGREFTDAWMDKNHPGHAAAVLKKENLAKMIAGVKP